ncbi:MAG: ABC transporter ATP-binding protein [Firmicutes bacterium]|jgi:ABC-type nitrate/sulfonate/bicarbonate transport system ATPase subunit|nr:ABC transporter ATP-binding protein [Bacillota bacterium]
MRPSTTAEKQAKLEARNLVKHFGLAGSTVKALDGFSLTAMDNEFVALVGPSGCGKSTFLRMVAGLTDLEEGTILVDGKPVSGPGPDRGMVFQSYTLFPWLTVLDNVIFPLRKSELTSQEREEVAMGYLEAVGLTDFAKAYPAQLSGGMRQRVAIARAFAARPSILLMDEPFGALDAQTRGMMQELLCEVWEQHRVTVVFVTHDVEEAVLLSDRIYCMSARPGRVKEEIPVPMPRPRRAGLETTSEFIAIRKRVMELLRSEIEANGTPRPS